MVTVFKLGGIVLFSATKKLSGKDLAIIQL
jgi:hypothetical protein